MGPDVTGTDVEGAVCWPTTWVGEAACDGGIGGGGGSWLGGVLTALSLPGDSWRANAPARRAAVRIGLIDRSPSPSPSRGGRLGSDLIYLSGGFTRGFDQAAPARGS